MKSIEERIEILEKKLLPKNENTQTTKREPSEYNKFVKKYITDNKSDKKTHKELFSEAAKAWKKSK